MAATTTIEWTDRTWNPVVGCSLVSPGCTHCYAMKMAGRIERMGTAPHYAGLTKASKAGPVWTGEVRAAPERILREPLRWRRPARVFVNSMSDLFHEGVADELVDQVFAVMAMADRHSYQVLTKRPERMRSYVRAFSPERMDRALRSIGYHPADVMLPWVWPLTNVWLGVSVEDQVRADERIPILLDTPAAVRWISAEPLLGPVDLRQLHGFHNGATPQVHDALSGYSSDTPWGIIANKLPDPFGRGRLDWVVAGGESGPGARPMHPDWVRSLRDQCARAGVAFLFKQWGEFDQNRSRVGKRTAGRLLDGWIHHEFPEAHNA